ncbi:unnamed protein product [Dovyalis caffra]|uniref:Uncharacterized protein n=1 Tax=Dovyalis caffra TaxID=77055 RepID=A0AAV1RVM0_9ROSI|nr:unnamed protein product [Dovyalis caffra]
MVVMEEEQVEKERPVILRDIRRYYCDYCGICKSKKSLITSHVLTHHKEDMDKQRVDGDEGKEEVKSNTCKKCGASFKKPAYLIQHMQSHSLELKRPFAFSVDDYHASYRRKDHLTRHLLLHEGKLLKCQIENCNCKFVYPSNLKRHVKELHDESSPSYSVEGEKQYLCQEPGCGKVFRYPSKLQTHEDSHGEDKRKNFMDHLYEALKRSGIRTFLDDDELPSGQEISPQLEKAIQESRISIVVFSKGYASSRWCLSELAKIMECRDTIGQIVLQLFYDIDPSDVRKQTGSFAEALKVHEERFKNEKEKVYWWRNVLEGLANLSGFALNDMENGYALLF